MYKILKNKIRNVNGKIYNEGEILPIDYIPPDDYISNGLIGLVEPETIEKKIKKIKKSEVKLTCQD